MAQCAGYTKPNLHNLKWAANRDLKWMIDADTHLPLHSPSFTSHTHLWMYTCMNTHKHTPCNYICMHTHTHKNVIHTSCNNITYVKKKVKKNPSGTHTQICTHMYTHICTNMRTPPTHTHKKQGKATQPVKKYNPYKYNICKVYLVCFERQKQHVQVKPTFLWNLIIVATVQWCFKWQKFI